MRKISVFLLLSVLLYSMMFVSLDSFASWKYSGYEKYRSVNADALVVFFGDFDIDGNPDRESLRRMIYAVELYKNGIGRNIIFVGGYRPARNLYGSSMLAEKAAELGVNPSNIFYDRISRDTIQNWNEAEKIIADKNFSRVVLVSSPYHLARIENMINIGSGISVYFAGYENSSINPPKSFSENITEFNYNLISTMTYIVLPSSLYQGAIKRLRS